MAYRQITSEERYMLSALRRHGLNQAEIARALGRHRSSISRELRRNHSTWDGGYRPFVASHRTRARRSRSRRNQRFTREDFRLVDSLLRQRWSPEQISGRLRREGRLSISHETIYIHVWSDKERGGRLYESLRCATKKRRSATTATTVEGGSQANVTSPRDPLGSRSAAPSATGRSIRW